VTENDRPSHSGSRWDPAASPAAELPAAARRAGRLRGRTGLAAAGAASDGSGAGGQDETYS
jgi:hypothetical protein